MTASGCVAKIEKEFHASTDFWMCEMADSMCRNCRMKELARKAGA